MAQKARRGLRQIYLSGQPGSQEAWVGPSLGWGVQIRHTALPLAEKAHLAFRLSVGRIIPHIIGQWQ